MPDIAALNSFNSMESAVFVVRYISARFETQGRVTAAIGKLNGPSARGVVPEHAKSTRECYA